ncbi:MAG: hypothetical protein JXL67_11070 [Calditrichaeota bacterium]|nr:hypothetical protein [Calditrichota bacterium]
MKKTIFLYLLTLNLFFSEFCTASSNIITITEKAGQSSSNYPLQIGRPFKRGEILNYPQIVIDGTELLTQADVKCRWDDGSVKHAVISCLIPSLPANSTKIITFQNQISGNNLNYLNKNQMLSSDFNFDGIIKLSNSVKDSTSARNMMISDAFTYWLKGTVVTSIIIADHSFSRFFDIGFDNNRSFRPIFHATFWPVINKVYIRFIGEISNTEVLQDQTYNLTLKAGNIFPETFFSQNNIVHHAASRWTKDFWLGGEPPAIEINHNLSYLSESYFIPNYDIRKNISQSAINDADNDWLNANKNILGDGNWEKVMGTAGGREEIGPYPTWSVQWLYTGDIRLAEKSFGNADLAASWPVHFREGNPNKFLDRNNLIEGIGKILSISSRPTIALPDYAYNYTDPDDRVVIVGPLSNGGWVPDRSHQPSPFYPQYVLSGDFWYLEEMMFWASWSAANSNGANTIGAGGRGPTGREGGLPGNTRAQAWAFRNRVETAFCIPDTMLEKQYFVQLIDDAISLWEGEREIVGTIYFNNPTYNWGQNIKPSLGSLGVPPLKHWRTGDEAFVQYPIDPNICEKAEAPWEQNFMMYALGRAKELDFETDSLVAYLGFNIIRQLTDPGYDPYFIASYRIPTVKLTTHDYFNSWSNLKLGFLESYRLNPIPHFQGKLDDPDHGYSIIAIVATAMSADLKNGGIAWEFIEREALTAQSLDDNPKWAIIPRNNISFINKPSKPTGLDVKS